MPTIHLTGRVDEHHRLWAEVPSSIAAGPVELTIVVPQVDEDAAGRSWADGVGREWAEQMQDPREDIYTINDGEPIDGAR